VEVDVVVVREQELHEAERVLVAGALPDARDAAVLEVLEVLGRHVARVRGDLGSISFVWMSGVMFQYGRNTTNCMESAERRRRLAS
jgi:hypothetical protein